MKVSVMTKLVVDPVWLTDLKDSLIEQSGQCYHVHDYAGKKSIPKKEKKKEETIKILLACIIHLDMTLLSTWYMPQVQLTHLFIYAGLVIFYVFTF